MVARCLMLAAVLMLMIPAGSFGAQDPEEGALVVFVNSGNTIDVQLADGTVERVRMVGVNAPRIDVPDFGDECFGPESTTFLTDWVSGQMVRLARDVSDRDGTGRLLRHVWIQDAGGTEVMVGEVLIAGGYAEANAIAPDVQMAEQLSAVEADARDRAAGQWGACP